MKILINVPNFGKLHAVYSLSVVHENGATEPIYYGCCEAAALMGTPDARRNSKFREISQTYPDLLLEFIEWASYIELGTQRAAALAESSGAICNKFPSTVGRSSAVRCQQTGKEYRSISAAARDIGAWPSSVSNHLNGLPGYANVKGLTFERIS